MQTPGGGCRWGPFDVENIVFTSHKTLAYIILTLLHSLLTLDLGTTPQHTHAPVHDVQPQRTARAAKIARDKASTHERGSPNPALKVGPLLASQREVDSRPSTPVVGGIHDEGVVPHPLGLQHRRQLPDVSVRSPQHPAVRVGVVFLLSVGPPRDRVVGAVDRLPREVEKERRGGVVCGQCSHGGLAVQVRAVSRVSERALVPPAIGVGVALHTVQETGEVGESSRRREMGHAFVPGVALPEPVGRVARTLQTLTDDIPTQVNVVRSITAEHFALVQWETTTEERASCGRAPVENVVRIQHDTLRRECAYIRCDVCVARVAVEGHVVKSEVILQNHNQMRRAWDPAA